VFEDGHAGEFTLLQHRRPLNGEAGVLRCGTRTVGLPTGPRRREARKAGEFAWTRQPYVAALPTVGTRGNLYRVTLANVKFSGGEPSGSRPPWLPVRITLEPEAQQTRLSSN
jgi:hypothetical protein